MTHGNMCSCDEGYYHSQGYDSVHSVYRQRCCKQGVSEEECAQAMPSTTPVVTRGTLSTPHMLIQKASALVRQANDVKEEHRLSVLRKKARAARDALVAHCWGPSQVSKKAFHKIYAAGYSDGKKERKPPTEYSPQDLGEAKQGIASVKAKLNAKRLGMVSRMQLRYTDEAITPRERIKGPRMISLRCEGLDAGACEQAGCVMSVIDGEGVACTDATSWQCAVTKRVLDCKNYRMWAPAHAGAVTDQLCGQLMYTQKPVPYQVCEYGIRTVQVPIAAATLDCFWK